MGLGRRSSTRVLARVLCYTLLLQSAPAKGLGAASGDEWPLAGAVGTSQSEPPSAEPESQEDARQAYSEHNRNLLTKEAPAAPAPVPSIEPPPLPAKPERPAARPQLPTAAVPVNLSSPTLLLGDNLASIPHAPSDPSPAAVFSSIAGKFTRVYAADGCSGRWKVYDPADPAGSDLTAVDPTQGFWIEMTEPAPVPAAGTLPERTTIHLCAGWNLIGFPSGEPRLVRTALSSIEGKYVRVYGFDAADTADPWELYEVAAPPWASDLEVLRPGRGYWLLATEATDLTISNVAAEPELALTAPADLDVVTAPTEVLGTVRSDTLQGWTLSYRAHGDAISTVLASGNAPVVNGRLGTFDPTLLLNGGYTLELTATDTGGGSTTISRDVSIEGQMKIGHFTLTFQDLEIPLSGLPIEILRTYDSRDKQQGDFGIGWRLELRQGSYRNNRKPGDGWQLGQSFLPCDQIGETRSHLTTVRLSDREIYRFKLALFQGVPTLGGCFAQARFDFVEGPVPGATLAILGGTQVLYQNGANEVVDPNSLAVYEPQQVRLTTRDGRIFDLGLQQGVTRLEDLHGNALSITPQGITHTSGLTVAFERDGLGRITSVTDAEGESITYSYDAAGDLAAVSDREDHTTRFTYAANHHLLEIEDPLGRKAVRNDYDASGRLIRTTDASGKAIDLTHDLAAHREVITDRLGHSRVLEYDVRGNVVRETDALGKVTTRTFDAEDRQLTQTDPVGNTTAYTYDAFGDVTSVTDPEGGRTTYTYNSRGQVLTTLDPRGKLTTRSYDAAGNLTATTDPLGNVTTLTYDGAGNLLSETDAEGNVRSYVVDAYGNTIQETDALGHETAFTYDAAGNELTRTAVRTTPTGTETLTWSFAYDGGGRLIRSTDPDGTFTTAAYDHLGNVVEKVDKLGRRRTFTYDAAGLLTRTSYPDGTSETKTYDAEGRIESQTDRAGRTTQFEHDPLGRLLKTVLPDGAEIVNTFDAAGRRTATRDARGNTTLFEYDRAGRTTKVTDPRGGMMVVGHDAAGNQISVENARGETTASEYDDANRLVRMVFPDGTRREIGYDRRGQKISETDPAGKTTRYGYDPTGNLTTVTDALGQVTRFAFDELGNRISQSDTAGRVTRFDHDRLGRLIRRILPLGPAETKSYDAAGNLASVTDFGGATVMFTYDADDRLTRRSYPDGSSVIFTYTATGRRASSTDSRGTTTYRYDSRDRLTGVDLPGGRSLSYTYDQNGNRTALGMSLDGTTLTTGYSYDELNRLETVTDPQGRLYRHSYDANGNRAAVDYPNGLRTTYGYDDLNRLTSLETRNGVGAVVQSYLFTLGPAGNRTRVEEAGGLVRTYDHDDLYRLTGEVVSSSGVPQLDIALTYDPVGNRLTQVRADGSGTRTTAYTYDARDRLLTEGADSYTWDDNGHLVAKSGADAAAYAWDFDHRLVRVTKADGTVVTHAYNADGNRVRTEVTPATGPPTVVEYVVEASGTLSQVVAELEGASVSAYFVRGDDLLAVIRPAGTRFFHADGLGSIRALTDESGGVTDTYAFTASGELLAHTGSDPNAYLFAGEVLDANSGFYYLRARWMDPAVGRFLSADPFPGLIFEPLTLHKYLYAGADPVDRLDPSGLVFGGFSGTLAGAIVNVQSRIIAIQVGGYTLLYTLRSLRALNWTLTAVRAIQARFGNLTVTLNEALVRSKSSIDIVLQRSQGSVQRVSIELKNWSFDSIARSGRAEGMLEQLGRQARNFRAENIEAIYSFAETATTGRGQRLLERVVELLSQNGHRITFGTQKLLDEIAKLL